MRKWTPWIVGSLCLATLAACEGNRRDNETGTAGSGTESGTMQGGATTDTSLSGAGAGAVGDTAATQPGTGATGGQSADTARTSGRSESDTTSSSREPVTAKGDTLRGGTDSTAVGQQ
jgi:hypothetical protein